jgi:hypothetical protein
MKDQSQTKRNARWRLYAIACLLVFIGVNEAALADKKPESRTFDSLVNPAGGEPVLAVSLKDPNSIVYAGLNLSAVGQDPLQGSNATTRNLWYSRDGGRTWKDSGSPSGGDPQVVSDRQGNFYFVSASQVPGQPVENLKVSTDGGATWGTPITISPQGCRSWLTIDLSTETLYNSLECYHYPDVLGPREIRASHDQGRTWGPTYREESVEFPAVLQGAPANPTTLQWTGIPSAWFGRYDFRGNPADEDDDEQ